MKRKFRITTKEKTTVAGAKFLVHSAYINNQWYKVKFNKDCTTHPKEKGLYYVVAEDKDLNMQKKAYDRKDGAKGVEYILWVHNCELERVSQEELDEYKCNQMNQIFGVPQGNMKDVSPDDDLPF